MQKSLSGRSDTKRIHRVDTDSQPPVLKSGLRIGKYQIEDLESVSSEGVALYSAHDVERGALVAIKVPDASIQLDHELLREEVRKIGQLNHPSVCPVLHLLTGDSFTGVASPWATGTQLSEAKTSLNFQSTIDLTRSLLSSLSQAHMLGIAHGGLNPDRIYLSTTGLQIADFGLARVMPPSPSRYTAPDATAIAEPSADTFSLGVLFGELLLPHIDKFGTDNGRKLRGLLKRMTASGAEERPHSMARVAAELTLILPGAPDPEITADTLVASLETRLQSEKRAKKVATVKEKPSPDCERHIKAIQTLVSAGSYTAAQKQLTEAIKSSEDSTIVSWSREKYSKLKSDIKKFKANRNRVLADATRLHEQHEHDGALRKLETIPREFHSKQMQQLEQIVGQDIEEIELLSLQIDAQFKPNDASLIPDLERLLELQPNDTQYREMLDKLIARKRKKEYSRYSKLALKGLLCVLAVSVAIGAVWFGIDKLRTWSAQVAEAEKNASADADKRRALLDAKPERKPWISTKPSKPLFASLDQSDVTPRTSKSAWSFQSGGVKATGHSILWTGSPVMADAFIVKPRVDSTADVVIGASARWGTSEIADGIRVRVSDSSTGSINVGGVETELPMLSDVDKDSELRIEHADDKLSIKWNGKAIGSIDVAELPQGFVGVVGGSDLVAFNGEGLRQASPKVHEVARLDKFYGRLIGSNDGRLIVKKYRTLQVYDWTTEENVCEVSLDSDSVRLASLIEKGSKLLVITSRSAKVFHTSSGLLARELTSFPVTYRYVAISPDGSLLSASDGSRKVVTINVRNDEVERRANGLKSDVHEIQFVSPSRCGFVEGSSLSVHGATGQLSFRITPKGGGVSRFVCNGKNIVVTKSTSGTIEAWSSSGQRLGQLTTQHGDVRTLSLDGAGRYCMASHSDGQFSLWTLGDRSLQHDLPPDLSKAFLIDDVGFLAAKHSDGSFRIWKMAANTGGQQYQSPRGKSYSGSNGSSYYERPGRGRSLSRPNNPKSSRSSRSKSNGRQMID